MWKCYKFQKERRFEWYGTEESLYYKLSGNIDMSHYHDNENDNFQLVKDDPQL